MDEQETKEEKQPTSDTGEGSKPEADGLVGTANAAAERLEAANKKAEELLQRREEVAARELLGGTADAGAAPVKKEPVSAEQFAKDFQEGKIPNILKS